MRNGAHITRTACQIRSACLAFQSHHAESTRFLSMVRIFSGRHEWRVLARGATLKKFDTSCDYSYSLNDQGPVATTA